MRVTTGTPQVAADPGGTTAVVLDVVNTSSVIDGVSGQVIGLPDEQVSFHPPLLPLFPEATGQLTLSLKVPSTYPAGSHPLTVQLVSHGAREPSTYLDLQLDVAPRPSLQMLATPRLVRARRSGQFVLEVRNDGNVPLEVAMRATEAERAVTASFSPAEFRINPGAVVTVILRLRGPRLLTGGEFDRTVTVAAIARRTDAPSAAALNAATPDAAPPEDRAPGKAADTVADADIPGSREVTVRLRQLPVIGRGPTTAVILIGILCLWATAFLVGIKEVFGGDPMTKQVPASFFAALASNGSGAQKVMAGALNAVDGTPAGALSKSGQLESGLGGQITGTVKADSDLQPAGRILVTAYRKGRSGLEQVSSAATQADGSFSIAGLFPTDYYLKFSAAGYRTTWYPEAPTSSGAHPIPAASGGVTNGVDVIVHGMPATVTGSVYLGPVSRGVVTTVMAQPLDATGTVSRARSRTVTTTNGSYTIKGLEAPGRYLFTFVTPGYDPTTLVDSIGGGDQRKEPVVTPSAGMGQVGGLILASDGTPIGGATVTTTVGGVPTQVTTPTTGQVGAFTLSNLPTPGTYVVTVTADNFGAATQVFDLKAGQSRAGVIIRLKGGDGAVSGRLVDKSGAGLGGASVSVTGAATSDAANGVVATTTTLTSGAVGSFVIGGLAAGQYTFTFTLDGYQQTSVPVTIRAGAPAPITVRMAPASGQIVGSVTAPDGTPLPGAKVTATDGQKVFTTTSTAAGGALPDGTTFPAGGYYFTGLPAGTYSVTVTMTGYQSRTRIVEVVGGQTASGQDLRVRG